MYKNIHFISGLPRSGSTLLAAILRQNPRFYANMSGPICPLLYDMLGHMSGQNEYYVFISDEQRERILKGVVENYYCDYTDAEVIFDTNRLWCSNLSMVKKLFPSSRIIACVRDIPWIIDSVEKLVHANAIRPSSIFKYSPSETVYSRVEKILASDGFLGFPFSALKEACFGPHASSLLLLQYETLVTSPTKALDAIYDFIGEQHFCHDFDNVILDNDEFDRRIGTTGLHRILTQVRDIKRETILPPDIFMRFEGESFWKADSVASSRFSVI
jgi:sulfotransferase